jgi:hypothetical protein
MFAHDLLKEECQAALRNANVLQEDLKSLPSGTPAPVVSAPLVASPDLRSAIPFAFWPYLRWEGYGAKGNVGSSASGTAIGTTGTKQKQAVVGNAARGKGAIGDFSPRGLARRERSSLIDLTTETLIALGDAARLLPRKANGKRIHIKTVARWCLYGVQGIKLESLKLGRERYTSKEACQRFAESLTGSRLVGRSTIDRSRADQEAERRLKHEGF